MNFGALKLAFICSALLLLCAFEAEAHQIYVFAALEGDRIEGRAYFSGNVAAAHVGVEVTDGAGRVLGELVTDEDGRFTFTPVKTVPHTFVVQTEDGHRASFTLELAAEPDAPRVGGAVPASGAFGEDEHVPFEDLSELRREITGIREQIDRLDKRIRLRDVLGGIGYIVGVMGLIAFWKARSRPE